MVLCGPGGLLKFGKLLHDVISTATLPRYQGTCTSYKRAGISFVGYVWGGFWLSTGHRLNGGILFNPNILLNMPNYLVFPTKKLKYLKFI